MYPFPILTTHLIRIYNLVSYFLPFSYKLQFILHLQIRFGSSQPCELTKSRGNSKSKQATKSPSSCRFSYLSRRTMPKVISRAAVSTSDSAPATASSKAILRTYYCLCGEFLLVIDKSLDKLPRRPSDGAIVVRCRDDTERGKIGRKFKLNAVEGKRHLVKR